MQSLDVVLYVTWRVWCALCVLASREWEYSVLCAVSSCVPCWGKTGALYAGAGAGVVLYEVFMCVMSPDSCCAWFRYVCRVLCVLTLCRCQVLRCSVPLSITLWLPYLVPLPSRFSNPSSGYSRTRIYSIQCHSHRVYRIRCLSHQIFQCSVMLTPNLQNQVTLTPDITESSDTHNEFTESGDTHTRYYRIQWHSHRVYRIRWHSHQILQNQVTLTPDITLFSDTHTELSR